MNEPCSNVIHIELTWAGY